MCPTLCDSKDHSLPGFSVHGILQARILEWGDMPSRGSSWPWEWSWASFITGRFFTTELLGKPISSSSDLYLNKRSLLLSPLPQSRAGQNDFQYSEHSKAHSHSRGICSCPHAPSQLLTTFFTRALTPPHLLHPAWWVRWPAHSYTFAFAQFGCSVTSNSLWPHESSTPGLPVHQQLPEFTQTQVHRVHDAIQPSHPPLSPSPPAPNPSQHQRLFQWVNSSHEVAKGLEFQL